MSWQDEYFSQDDNKNCGYPYLNDAEITDLNILFEGVWGVGDSYPALINVPSVNFNADEMYTVWKQNPYYNNGYPYLQYVETVHVTPDIDVENTYNATDENYFEYISKLSYVPSVKVYYLDSVDAIIGELEGYDTSITVDMSYKQGTRRTCSLSVIGYDDVVDSVFWVGRKLKLVCDVGEHSVDIGVFYVLSFSQSNGILSLSCGDKYSALTELNYTTTESNVAIGFGSTVGGLVRSTLAMSNGKGQVLDSVEPLISGELITQNLLDEVSANYGTKLGDILINVADSISSDIFYDNKGQLHVESRYDEDINNYGYLWKFDDVSISKSQSYSSIVNEQKVLFTDAYGNYSEHIAKNESVKSIYNISSVGIQRATPIECNNVMTKYDAECYARYMLRMSNIKTISVSFEFLIIPHMDVGKIIVVNEKRYFVESVSMRFGEGIMSVSCVDCDYLRGCDL